MKDISIQDKDVVLRTVTEDDLEIMMNWRNDPEVSDYLFSDIVYTIEGQKKWFENMKTSEDVYLIAEFNGKKFGIGNIVNIDLVNKKCEVGGHIGEISLRGKGLGKKIFQMLTDYCFKELGVNKVYLRVLAFNEIAIKLYEKIGFKEEGKLRQDIFKKGKFEDVVVMSILKDEFVK